MTGSTEGQRPHFDRAPQLSTPTEQHKPQQKGGNGAPGIPPTLNERANPPPERLEYQPQNAKSNPPVENPSLTQRRGAVFDCAVPEIRPSPIHIRSMLRHGLLREEQAQEAEQEWRENLKTWNRGRLEKAIRSAEESRDSATSRNRQEVIQDLGYELEALRTELWQRE